MRAPNALSVPVENACDVASAPSTRRLASPRHVARTKSQNGKRSRSKGAQFERDAAAILRAIYPGAERNIAQARSARREGCDIKGTPWWVECKVGARINLKQAYGQALSDGGNRVLVIAKQDRREAVVYVGLDHLNEALGIEWPTHAGWLAQVQLPLFEFVELVADFQRHRIASALSGDPTEPFERGTP